MVGKGRIFCCARMMATLPYYIILAILWSESGRKYGVQLVKLHNNDELSFAEGSECKRRCEYDSRITK